MASIEISNDDLRAILNAVEKAQSELENIRAKIAKLMGETTFLVPPEWERKRLKVWAKIHEKGDLVTYEEWQKIIREVGYDPRGTGGFFAGDNPSLIWVGEDKVALAKWAAQEVEKYRQWLESQEKK
jgi:tetrahydromethanopterin S-methyltransferase subunit G